MDSISPLAKILAEANGIDWRSIRGSGEGGNVVEQDILNYLSRIMSGDEEPPATPVDEAPPGWTGDMPPMPAAVAASGLQALSAAGVESDITDFVAQQSQAGQTAEPQAVVLETLIVSPAESQPGSTVPGVAAAQLSPVVQGAESEFAIGRPGEDDSEGAGSDLDFELDDDLGADLDDDQARGQSIDGGGAGGLRDQSYTATVGRIQQIQAPFGEVPFREVPAPDHQLPGQQAPLAALPKTDGRSAYDPVAPDEDADSVLADAFPGALPDAPVPADMTVPAGSPAPAQAADAAPVAAEPTVFPFVPSVEQPAPSQDPIGQDAPEAPEATSSKGGFGLGGFLSRLYGAKPESVQPEPVQSVPVQQAETTDGSAHGEPLAPAVLVPAEMISASPVLSEAVLPETLLGEPLTFQVPSIPDTPVAALLVADQWRDQEIVSTPAPEHDGLAVPKVLDHSELGQPIALPEAHESGLEVEQTVPNWPSVFLPQAHAAQEPAHQAVQAAAPAHGQAVHEQPVPEQADVEAPAASQPAASVPVPQSGIQSGAQHQAITLRLNVDLSVLEAARVQLSEALFRDVPLALLVARAAARSVATLALTAPGGVALADHAGQPLDADLNADFRASLGGLTQPAHTQPALLVLNAAELGLDELHRGECSLSVGRAGAGDSALSGGALSLRGDVDPVRGARFMHEVAGLLDAPIRLLF